MSGENTAVPDFVWGFHRDIKFDCNEESLPTRLPEGRIWIKRSLDGDRWLAQHVQGYMDNYVKRTSLALASLA